MPFPTIADADTKNGTVTSNSTSWTITYPTNIAAGDLLLLFIGSDGAPDFSAPGFTVLAASQLSAVTAYLLGKVAAGTETGTFTATSTASEQGGWRIFRIPAAGWFGGTLNTGSGGANDSSGFASAGDGTATGNPNPPNLDPASWGTEDTLWIAACAVDTSRTISAYPLTGRNTADVSGGSTGATLGLCTTTSTVSSLDPGTFTTSASDDWCALTVAIRPAASGGLSQSPSDDINNLADARRLGYGNLHTDSVNNLADTVSVVIGHALALSDNANNLADGAVRVTGILNLAQDSLQALTDALAQLLTYQLAFADSEAANWADAHQLLLSQFLALSDTGILTDSAIVTLGQQALLTDSFTLSDQAVVVLGYEFSATDSLADLTDDYSQTESQLKSFSDTLTPVAAVPRGLNFRFSLEFVTDGPNQTFVIADSYPITSDGLTFGYLSVPSSLDQNTDVDVRLAGEHLVFNDSGTVGFRVDLPPGNYDISLALGSMAGGRRTYFTLLDDVTPLFSLAPVATSTGEFADAEGSLFSAADWPANNVPVSVTVSSGILRFVVGTNVEDFGVSSIAHLGLVPQETGPAGLADDLQLGHGLHFDDSVALNDGYDQELISSERKLILNDTLTLDDSIALGRGLLPADALDSFTDTFAARGDSALAVVDVLSLADSETHVLDLQLAFTDTVSLTDSLALNHGLLFSDLLALTDAFDVQLGQFTSVADALAITDSESHLLSQHLTFSDDINLLADAVAPQLAYLTSPTDTIALLADTHTLELNQRLSLVDVITLTDSYADDLINTVEGTAEELADNVNLLADELTLGAGLILDDSVANLDDVEAHVLGYTIAYIDSIANLNDAVSLQLYQLLDFDDLLVLVDSESSMIGQRQSLSDAIANFADAVTVQLDQQLVFAESIDNLADISTQAVGFQLNFSDLLPLTDIVQLGYGLEITEDIDLLIDSIVTSAPQGPLRQVGVTDSVDNLTDAVVLRLDYLLTVADATNLSDDIALQEGLLTSFSDSLALTDSSSATLGHLLPLVDQLTLNDSIQLRLGYGLPLADAIALTDSTNQALSYHLPLSDNVALLADFLAKSLGLTLIIADNGPTLLDDIDLFSAWLLSLIDSLALTDSLAKFSAGLLPLNDSLSLTDDIDIDLRGPDLDASLNDSLTLTDAITITLGNELRIQLVISDVVTLTDHYFDLRHPYTPSTKRHIVVPSRARTTTVPERQRLTVVPVRDRTTRVE